MCVCACVRASIISTLSTDKRGGERELSRAERACTACGRDSEKKVVQGFPRCRRLRSFRHEINLSSNSHENKNEPKRQTQPNEPGGGGGRGS